jgi:hypothetical protein
MKNIFRHFISEFCTNPYRYRLCVLKPFTYGVTVWFILPIWISKILKSTNYFYST